MLKCITFFDLHEQHYQRATSRFNTLAEKGGSSSVAQHIGGLLLCAQNEKRPTM